VSVNHTTKDKLHTLAPFFANQYGKNAKRVLTLIVSCLLPQK
jgi:Na+/proline symporter